MLVVSRLSTWKRSELSKMTLYGYNVTIKRTRVLLTHVHVHARDVLYIYELSALPNSKREHV